VNVLKFDTVKAVVFIGGEIPVKKALVESVNFATESSVLQYCFSTLQHKLLS